ncbi:MAG: DNA primase, partial [Candidatus Gastranaerophilaceae bacterium]
VVLKKSGANYWGLCPFHNDKKPSFCVSPSKGIYKCFSCGAGGDALSFIIKTENREFKEVIAELADKFGIEMPKTFHSNPEAKTLKDDMKKACKTAAKFYQEKLVTDEDASKAMRYLSSRDIDDTIIKSFSLGWAPNHYHDLYDSLKITFSDEVLEKAGLIIKGNKGGWIDRFRNRIIIPIRNESGDYVAFGARAVDEGQNPKYLNSSDSLIYNKSKLLYGLYNAKEAIQQDDAVIIMEGYFDVISTQAHGIKNCVASCGTAFTSEHVKLLSRYTKSRRIYLSFDTDSAGVKATNRGGEIIKETFKSLGNIKQFDESHIASGDDKYSCEIRVISPPEGKDPDEFIRSVGADEYRKYIATAPLLLDFQLNTILKQKNTAKTPQEKSRLVSEILPILGEINNKIIQGEYVKIVSGTLDVNEESLLKELKKYTVDDSIPMTPLVAQTNVTKSSQIEINAQKNLLSVFLIEGNPFTLQQISAMVPQEAFTDEKLIIVKTTIDKISCIVNNVRELVEQLYTEFIEDETTSKIITDLIYLSEAYKGLPADVLEKTIQEIINKIKQIKKAESEKVIKKLYDSVNDDDVEALKVQMKLRDKIKLGTGD